MDINKFREENKNSEKPSFKMRMLKELKELVIILAVFIVFKTFFFQPFGIPSGSMYPTLEVGDMILVNKMSFGYSNYSYTLKLPMPGKFNDLTYKPNIHKGRIWESKPKRGEVLVFTGVKDLRVDYIKRLIGMPGDTIQMRGGYLYINGKICPLKRLADYRYRSRVTGRVSMYSQYEETLPNGLKHRIIKRFPLGKGMLDNTPEFKVQANHYFMMGDNRDDSDDSRAMNVIGYVPFSNVVGPAKLIFFSTDARWYEVHKWLFGLKINRFLNVIR